MYDLLLVSVNSPIIFGIYDRSSDYRTLLASMVIEGKTSDILPMIFYRILASNPTPIDSIMEISLHKKNLQSYNLNYFNQKLEISQDSHLFENCGDYVCCKLDSIIEQKNAGIEQLFSSFANFKDIYYANGVGSLSAIKLTHVFLQTLKLTKNINLHAKDSFYFARHDEIKAFKNMSFFKRAKENEFVYELGASINPIFSLRIPTKFSPKDFSDICNPLYVQDILN